MIRIYLKNKVFFLFILTSIISSALSAFEIIILGLFTTSLISKNFNLFIIWTFLLVIVLFISVLFSFIKNFLSIRINQKIILKIRNNIHNNFLNDSHVIIENNKFKKYHSDLTSNIELIYKNGLDSFCQLINLFFTISASLISIFILSWAIGLIIIGLIGLFLLFPLIFNKYLTKLGSSLQNSNNIFVNKINNLLEGFSTFYLHNKMQMFTKKIFENSFNLAKAKTQYSKKTHIIYFYISLFSIFFQILIFLLAGLFYFLNLDFYLGIGSVISITFFAGPIFNDSATFFENVSKVQSTRQIIMNYLNQNYNNKNETSNNVFSQLKIENLSFKYQEKEKFLFENLNFTIEQGKKYALIGKSGSGKSTLLKILMGIEKNYQGKISINNKDIKNDNFKDLIFNYYNFINIYYSLDKDKTLLENIIFDNKIGDKNYLNDILNVVQADFININNLDQIKQDFSLGQEQRIKLASFLYYQKPIMIIDEAISNIDKMNLDKIYNNLFNQKDLTLIMISHQFDYEIINKFDYVIRLGE